MTQADVRTGEWVQEDGRSLQDIDYSVLPMKLSTDRYTSPEIAAAERTLIWSRAWQVVGRAADLREVGDWKEYKLLDQSYVVVRNKQGELRGFVNACRHRGNLLCEGSGNAKRGFLCQYHLWSYDLDGRLKGVLREDAAGIDRESNGLIPVQVETFAGFVFLNPDPQAAPLSDWLGSDLMAMLEPYRIDEMTTVMDVTDEVACNWKVIIDAFGEGYHINGIHPQLLAVIDKDPAKSRYYLKGDHGVACAPFEVANAAHFTHEEQVEGVRNLPETFPTLTGVMPRFNELVDQHRDASGTLTFPEGVSARTLLQQATRDTLSGMGMDLSGLTDAQMSDSHGWVLFPNFFMTVRAGECHVIVATPHESGDPNRCVWHVASHMWLPDDLAEAFRATPVVVSEPGTHEYFLALQQDYVQMPRQQRGLRQDQLEHLTLVQEEIIVAWWHAAYDRWMASGSAAAR